MARGMHPVTKLNLEMMKNSKDPLDVLRQWHILINAVFDTLLDLTAEDDQYPVTEYLGGIEEVNARVEEFLWEEAASRLAHYNPASNLVEFDHLPENLKLKPMKGGFAIQNVPVWMLGHGAMKKFHPAYHRDRPYVRKRQLWFWLIHKLKTDYLTYVRYWENSLIPKEPPQYARMLVRFETPPEHWMIKDLDKYIQSIHVVINSLRDNALIRSDRPRYFSYAVEWRESMDEGAQEPLCSFYVWTSANSFPTWDEPEVIEQTEFRIPLVPPKVTSEDDCPVCGRKLVIKLDNEICTKWICNHCLYERRRRK
ncbi:hypothetical protein GCM10025858_37490 [Alicyclobacillus sacchari]|uniref:hypothetical protein n=1 Tax=Alicyclobacillus sacchari TaxID=392010 RepID=UPI0023E99F20|nr:hypothetical protein [Alicyclobacillus sacchari]GMA59246.1 hypothetical protein GCM10025858_37490 [Alicyclobacillus sacchari]